MVSVDETAKALEGIFRIARFDRAGAASFGADRRACARSFWAYVLALPATLLLLAIDIWVFGVDQPWLYATSHLIGDVIEAAGFPLMLLPLTRWLGRGQRWAWLVTGYNWYGMVTTIASVTLLGAVSDFPGGIGVNVLRLSEVYFIVLEAFMFDAILEIGAVRAGVLVLIDYGFQLAVGQIADWISR
jgi:hypothetical protein